jgi:SPW repeat
MSTPLTHHPDVNGASPEAIPADLSVPGAADRYPLPATWHVIGAQAAAALAMLTGLWVAISPWFITLQYTGGNATAVDLISGLAVVTMGAFALDGPRGFAGLQLGNALFGIWLIIAGPILSQKHAIADPMYWSNSWAGGVLTALAVASITAIALRRPARR